MRIVLSGIETNNKGAELMLYAILQEIERKYPDAEVYVPVYAVKQGLNYLHTKISVKDKPYANIKRLFSKLHVPGILRRLHVNCNWFLDIYPVSNVDYFIDGSGFAFSDQWHPTEATVKRLEYHLKKYKEQGSKIIFLPQAFGPAKLQTTKSVLGVLNKYADVIMPRENVSLQYLLDCGLNKTKIKKYTDFTSLVQGNFPQKYKHLKGGICIIPNLRMIDKGFISFQGYIDLLVGIIQSASVIGKPVYLLNHEGKGDENLAFKCKEKISGSIEVVTGLNALEVKGLIASSYLCISSRFHGIASSLNSSVPCLSTSWSHKYEELYKDYGLSDCVLNINDINKCLNKVSEYLSTEVNEKVRNILDSSVPKIKKETTDMWNFIWNL